MIIRISSPISKNWVNGLRWIFKGNYSATQNVNSTSSIFTTTTILVWTIKSNRLTSKSQKSHCKNHFHHLLLYLLIYCNFINRLKDFLFSSSILYCFLTTLIGVIVMVRLHKIEEKVTPSFTSSFKKQEFCGKSNHGLN